MMTLLALQQPLDGGEAYFEELALVNDGPGMGGEVERRYEFFCSAVMR